MGEPSIPNVKRLRPKVEQIVTRLLDDSAPGASGHARGPAELLVAW